VNADADDVKDEPREEGAPREEDAEDDAEDDAEGVVNVPRRARTGAWFFRVCFLRGKRRCSRVTSVGFRDGCDGWMRW